MNYLRPAGVWDRRARGGSRIRLPSPDPQRQVPTSHLQPGWSTIRLFSPDPAKTKRHVVSSVSKIWRPDVEIPSEGSVDSRSQGASSRRKMATGATRVGRMRRVRVPASSTTKDGWGESLPHITSPDRQRRIEQLRRITGDSPAQYFRFPCRGRNLIALKLLQNLQCPVDSMQLSSRSEMLPGKKKSHEVGGGDRLDFLAQLSQRHAVNSRQQAPIAPLDLTVRLLRSWCEFAAQHLAGGFEFCHCRFNDVPRESQTPRERRDRHWPGGFHPAPDGGEGSFFRLHDARTFGCHPEPLTSAFDDLDAPHLFQRIEITLPFRNRRQNHQRQQRVMQLIGDRAPPARIR